MTNLSDYQYLDKKFFDYFPKNEEYDMITQHYAEMMGACLVNDKLIGEVVDLFHFLESNPTSQKLDQYYHKFHQDVQEICKQLSCDKKSMNDILKFQVKLGLLNLVMENGKFFQLMMSEIKHFYDNWLDTISKADRQYLSVDASKIMNNEKAIVYQDCINKYLVFKRWKDKLHTLYMDTINIQMRLVNDYIQKETNAMNVFFELITHLLKEKYANTIVNIDELVYLVRGYYFNFVRKIFGGKALGLALLKENGFNIPVTFVIAVNCKNPDLLFLKDTISYAVRSSADIEDGQNYSFAGMFDSFLDIKKSDLPKYIQKVKDSVNSSRLKTYLKQVNLQQPNMAIIIQEYKTCEYAGVWLGKDLQSGGIEWVEGSGEKLVSGIVTPHIEAFCLDQDNNPQSLKVNGKSVAKQILQTQNKIYSKTKKMADIEWCICDGELFFLQYRALTATVDVSKNSFMDTSADIVGVPCSQGAARGIAKFVQNPETTKEWNSDDILLVTYTSPEWITLMIKAKAIITCYGGFFSHAGIIAREFGIPCVSGIGNLVDKLDGKLIEINGSTGEINILE